MKHLHSLAFAAAAMLASTTWASAQEAFTTGDVNMRAGPGSRYPVVTTIPSEREVFIHGCLSNWDWCDVSWRRTRGWVFSDYLEAHWRGRRVVFDEYRTFIDIPFVSFSFGYWDRHYRDRPWFDEWDYFGEHSVRRVHRSDDFDDGRRRDRRESWSEEDEREDDNRVVRRRGDNRPDEDELRGMRCGTEDADPSCPDSSRGRRLQMNQD